MSHPYLGMPPKAYWKSAVAGKDRYEIEGLWTPKFRVLPRHKVSTFGSCFAQHIGRSLRDRGFRWFITEAPPAGMTPDALTKFNYDLFSCRTGNIYTTTMLLQWVKWAIDPSTVPDEVWEKDGRFYDPFRPRIEPTGFVSADEMRASRLATLKAFRKCIERSNFFVFTLGLTESWFNKSGYEYPMCPGASNAGTFDPDRHKFVNQGVKQVRDALFEAIVLMRSVNKRLRFILTVSPVPLTATASGMHVVVATMHSKSVLRAVAGALAQKSTNVDYFPSFEIITSPVFNSEFFASDKRRVADHGIRHVMDTFFRCQVETFGEVKTRQAKSSTRLDEVCEERLLESFA